MSAEEDPATELIRYLQNTPGALEDFLAGHEANNRWPWQKAWWWCHWRIYLLKTAIFGEKS